MASIRAGDNPKGRTDRQPTGGRKVRYGALGLKRGVPKDQQARNQNPKPDDPNGPQSPVPTPGADLSYLSDKQQAAVQKWLGSNYDPSKPLNVQIFQARWQAADQEGRRALAKRISGEYLEGGPTAKTLSGFHSEYLNTLAYENTQKGVELKRRMDDFNAQFGGYATTQEQADRDIAYWTNFASTAEGQAHIAQSGISPEDWLAQVTAPLNEGVANYTRESDYWARVQQTAAALGQEVPGFKPPGWDSWLQDIQAGTGPLPGALTLGMYSGIAGDIAGIEPISTGQLLLNRRNAGLMPAARDATNTGQATPTTGASLYPVSTPTSQPQIGNSHPSITGFDYNDMISEVF